MFHTLSKNGNIRGTLREHYNFFGTLQMEQYNVMRRHNKTCVNACKRAKDATRYILLVSGMLCGGITKTRRNAVHTTGINVLSREALRGSTTGIKKYFLIGEKKPPFGGL